MLIDDDMSLHAWCQSCRHHVDLDLDALGKRLGYEHSTMADELAPKLKCSACGSRKIGLILSARQTGKRLDG